MTGLREAVAAATTRLTEAGVPSPWPDAVALAAHALRTDRSGVQRAIVLGHEAPAGYAELVEARADRVPLQHLTGRAPFRRLDLHVGPGAFVPRPETEDVAGLAVEAALALTDETGGPPLVVDLCTGSGAIALAVADEVPGAEVVAVEVSALALAWAERNVAETGLAVRLVAGDATTRLPELADLAGRVDVVVSNPPYIPTGMVPTEAEVRDHDPEVALYGGSADGLAIPLAVAARAAELLRPGGLLVMEHADVQGATLPPALAAAGWVEVADHPDLTGRPRAVTARTAPVGAA